MTELDDRFTRVFAEIFDSLRWTLGVRVVAVAADGSEVEVAVTFRAGHRYCCYESSCYFAHYAEHGWRRVRAGMDRHGLAHLPLPVIRTFHGIIEPGAVAQPGVTGHPEMCFVSDGERRYETGPWQPVVTPEPVR